MAGVPCYSQASPSAYGAHRSLKVGAGVSNFDLDWGHQRMDGFTVWSDWSVFGGTSLLRRFIPEAEFRDIDFGRPSNLSRMRQTSLQGGLNITLYERNRFRVYGKGLVGWGHMEIPVGSIPAAPELDVRSLLVYSAGAGVDYSVTRHFVVRGDYETQWWPNLAYRGTALTPNGFTVGAAYSF